MKNNNNKFQKLDLNSLQKKEMLKNEIKQRNDIKQQQKQESTQTLPNIDELEETDFRRVCWEILEEKKKVTITNYNEKKDLKQKYYTFDITKEKFIIKTHENETYNSHTFNCKTNELTYNKQPQNETFLEAFVKKINKIGNDLETNKAQAFYE